MNEAELYLRKLPTAGILKPLAMGNTGCYLEYNKHMKKKVILVQSPAIAVKYPHGYKASPTTLDFYSR